MAGGSLKQVVVSSKALQACRLNFSLLRSAIMCLRGSRSATHRPASPLSGDIIDLSSAEGRVPNED